MSDSEEDLYHLEGFEEDDYNYNDYQEEDVFDEYDPYDHDLELVDQPDFSKLENVQFVEMTKHKSLRSNREIALDRMRGILSQNVYGQLSAHIRKMAYEFVEKLPEKQMVLYNIEILTSAALYMIFSENEVSKSSISKFLKETQNLPNVDHLDFIRYIQILSRFISNK